MRVFPFALALLSCLAVAGLFGGRADASGLDVPMIGTSFSGPTTADAAAVYWNPAMLGFQRRGQLNVSLGFAAGRIEVQRRRLGTYQLEDGLEFDDPIDPAYLDPSKAGGTASVRSSTVSPVGDVFISSPLLGDRVALGFGASAPYAAIVDFPMDGAQRWQIQQASIAVVYMTAAVAVKVHDRVSIGGGVSYVLGTGSISRVQDFGAVQLFADALAGEPISQDNDFGESAPTTVRELDVLARPFSFTGGVSHGVTFNLGLALRPGDATTIGLAYENGSQLRLRGEFALDMNEEFFTQDLAPQGFAFPPLVQGDAVLSFRLPKRISAGITQAVGKHLSLVGSVALVLWSEFEAFDIVIESEDLVQETVGIGARNSLSIPRNWNNSVHVELGARVAVHERVRLSGTLGYQSPASPDSTIDAASPDGQRLIGAAGVAFSLSERLALIVDGELQGILPREVRDSDYDLGNGRYKMLIGTGVLHLQVALGHDRTK